tara:strand:- start:4104 stop:4994 length:891 start_codon:yes stop_codon:yes gene_type:complete
MMTWEIYIENRIVAHSGWYYVNQDVADKVESFNGGGIYVYTDRYRWAENKYKIGLTRRNEKRVYEQGDAFQSEDAYVVDFIPLDIPDSQYDKRVHLVLVDNFNCKIMAKESSGRETEWIKFPEDACPTGTITLAIQFEQKDPNAGRVELMFTLSQIKALDKALEQYKNGEILLAELCPRFGKTVWAMALFDHTDKQVMVVSSYVHSVFNSFKTDYARFTQFQHIALADSIEQVNQNTANGLRSLVLVPLTDNFNRWKEKYDWVNKISSKFVFVDEADFGAHKPSQVKKVQYLLENA